MVIHTCGSYKVSTEGTDESSDDTLNLYLAFLLSPFGPEPFILRRFRRQLAVIKLIPYLIPHLGKRSHDILP